VNALRPNTPASERLAQASADFEAKLSETQQVLTHSSVPVLVLR